jgi:hypothetical protein
MWSGIWIKVCMTHFSSATLFFSSLVYLFSVLPSPILQRNSYCIPFLGRNKLHKHLSDTGHGTLKSHWGKFSSTCNLLLHTIIKEIFWKYKCKQTCKRFMQQLFIVFCSRARYRPHRFQVLIALPHQVFFLANHGTWEGTLYTCNSLSLNFFPVSW